MIEDGRPGWIGRLLDELLKDPDVFVAQIRSRRTHKDSEVSWAMWMAFSRIEDWARRYAAQFHREYLNRDRSERERRLANGKK